MKKYAYINGDLVALIYNEDKSYLWDDNLKKNSILIPDDLNVMVGWKYDGVNFIDSHVILKIDRYKNELINKSKVDLEDYLKNHHLTFIDGKQYSVTKDKQTLLANALQVYQLKIVAGQTDAILRWNAAGEECTEWTFENLAALALAIANYVEPLVAKQQALEVQIRNCTTLDEIESIVIDYETV